MPVTSAPWSADPGDYDISYDLRNNHDGVVMDGAHIDRQLVPVVAKLWNAGLRTVYSCQGGASTNPNATSPTCPADQTGYLVIRTESAYEAYMLGDRIASAVSGYDLIVAPLNRRASGARISLLVEEVGPLGNPGPSVTIYWDHRYFDQVRRLLSFVARGWSNR